MHVKKKFLTIFRTCCVYNVNDNVINFKNYFKIKHVYIDKLINKLFTFTSFR